VERLGLAQAQRELVLLREPAGKSKKKYDAWDKVQRAAFDKDWGAFDDMIKTVPTAAAGALIWRKTPSIRPSKHS
jgi:hypothetical protein